jgi:antitoxin (DNA-binding transcriptional repressor) of toxin-antitoxin stability system
VGDFAQLFEQGAPVADAVALDAHELHMSAGAEEAVLQVALHAVGDGEGDDEGGDSGGDSGDGDGGDDADHGLAALGLEVTRG